MRHALLVAALVVNLAFAAASGLTPVAMSYSWGTAPVTQDLGTVVARLNTVVAIDGSDPFYTYPFSPVCPNGPQASHCSFGGN